jgi:hypothetical protein
MSLYATVDSYLQNNLKRDLEKYFGIVEKDGVRLVASVKRPLSPEMEIFVAPRDPEIFSALVFHLAVAEFALDNHGRRNTLEDFLLVSGWPSFDLRQSPADLIRSAGLPDWRKVDGMAEAASEIVYKEVEHTLKHGQVRTRETAAVAAAKARLEEDRELADEILGQYQAISYTLANEG